MRWGERRRELWKERGRDKRTKLQLELWPPLVVDGLLHALHLDVEIGVGPAYPRELLPHKVPIGEKGVFKK